MRQIFFMHSAIYLQIIHMIQILHIYDTENYKSINVLTMCDVDFMIERMCIN